MVAYFVDWRIFHFLEIFSFFPRNRSTINFVASQIYAVLPVTFELDLLCSAAGRINQGQMHCISPFLSFFLSFLLTTPLLNIAAQQNGKWWAWCRLYWSMWPESRSSPQCCGSSANARLKRKWSTGWAISTTDKFFWFEMVIIRHLLLATSISCWINVGGGLQQCCPECKRG